MNQNLNILIVEDDVITSHTIKNILLEAGYSEIKIAQSGEKAIQLLSSFYAEVILMDIDLGTEKLNGIETSKVIRKVQSSVANNEQSNFIFITGHYHSIDINDFIEIGIEAFFSKPFRDIDILNALKITEHKIISRKKPSDKKSLNYLFLRSKESLQIKIHFEEILFIKGDGAYCRVKLQSEPNEIIQTFNLSEFQRRFHHPDLIRCHSSWIINVQHIHAKQGNILFMRDVQIPIGRVYSRQVNNALGLE